MNWTDRHNWRNTIVSTTLCLIGCSIGTLGALSYSAEGSWLYSLAISLFAGFLACVIFIAFWNIVFLKIAFMEAIKKSFKMSIVPMGIIIITENIIMFISNSMHHSYAMTGDQSHNVFFMLIAMSFGFFLALPYNYYILSKTAKECHE